MSFFFSKLNTRERPADGLARLRYALETMPSSKKYQFTNTTRSEILAELYDAFWGSHSHFFLPQSNNMVSPMQELLSEVQRRSGFGGNGRDNDPIVPGRICGRVFQKGESCYRCKDCALDESCVMCSRCFNATDHTGHNISLYLSQQPGGCCDCGDAEAWRHSIGCPHHPLAESNSLPAKATARTLENWTPKVHNPYRVNIPIELRDSMARTVAYALDFILDTLDYSPDEAITPRTEDELRAQPTADPTPVDMFAIVVWNDEKHSFEDVAQIISDTIGMPRPQALMCADTIDELGRDVVKIGSNMTRLLEIAQLISHIDLGVTVKRVHDYFREQITAVVIEWLLDLTQSRLNTDTIVIREVIGAELLAPRKKDSSSLTTNLEASKVIAEVKDPARLDWLFLYHTRLWKKPRLSLKQVYLSVLTLSHEHKLAVATHFANVYHRIIDSYLLVDREPENSIKYFALRLFTVPSIAQHIVRNHSVVSRLLSIITAFFTNQIANKRVIFPPAPRGEVDVESYPFKSKRFMPVFSDLRFICSNECVQYLIAKNPEFITSFTKVCQLFMGINPNRRAAQTHVEYETEAWISVFNVTVSLSRVIKVYGDAFSRGNTTDLLTAIGTVMHSILSVCTLVDDRLDRAKYSTISFHEVHFNNVAYQVVEFDVLTNHISFHHSLHWLLAELFKHVDLLIPEYLIPLVGGSGTLREVVLQHGSERAMLTVIDFPLRVLAMIAQIRSGLWVRNGFAIRGQLLHYRDFMLRELCFDQDIFILQSAFPILDVDLVLVSILDRFQLTRWFTGVEEHVVYDTNQLYSMVEEFLYILTACINERGNATKLSLKATIRRELIHALATGPCSFTDILKRVAERMVDDVCFERVLAEVATFRSPEGTSDSGVYELRSELYSEIDPFFFHYSRNKREEVESILRSRIKLQTGEDDPVLVPTPMKIDSGPFTVLPTVLLSDTLLNIMFHSLANIIGRADKSGTVPAAADAILDQALHLIMLALVEQGSRFADLACQQICHENLTVLEIICVLEHHDKFKSFRSRASWVLNQLASYHLEAVNSVRRAKDSTLTEAAATAELRKKAAKARQAAIMRNFAAAQQSFLEQLDSHDDEENIITDEIDDPVRTTYGTCIVCQEDLDDTRSFGSLGMIQPSRFIRQIPESNVDVYYHLFVAPDSLDRAVPDQGVDAPPVPLESLVERTTFGMHASVCGHMMHLECFGVYNTSIRQRHRTQAQRNHPETIARKEYICPLCKSLGNVILPVAPASPLKPSQQSFSDWIRSNGIDLLRSTPDRGIEYLQYKGFGNFTFWAAEDSAYQSLKSNGEAGDLDEHHRMVETVLFVARTISVQTPHLRLRMEPAAGERGAGAYLPEDLVAFTLSAMEISHRCTGQLHGTVLDNISEHSRSLLRGLLSCLSKLAFMQLKDRNDQGREAIRQAIVKRLLPEWKREAAYQHPLLLREPLTILVEIAAVAPEMLAHATVLLYYASLARVTVALLSFLSKSHAAMVAYCQRYPTQSVSCECALGDVATFVMSAARHSALLERTAQQAIQILGVERLGKLVSSQSLPFLRRAAMLLQCVSGETISVPVDDGRSEYARLLSLLNIPPPSEILLFESIQNLLSGWCTHYGLHHNVSPHDAFIPLEYPSIYLLAQLPTILDTLFTPENKGLICKRCKSPPADAGICLLCGTIICIQSHCCREIDYRERGECSMHTRDCAGAVGLYFSVKRCAILYLFANNGAFHPAPYMDSHGETDLCMRRGRRQYLHQLRLEEIRKVWLHHGIPTLVSRRLESTVDSGGWETL